MQTFTLDVYLHSFVALYIEDSNTFAKEALAQRCAAQKSNHLNSFFNVTFKFNSLNTQFLNSLCLLSRFGNRNHTWLQPTLGIYHAQSYFRGQLCFPCINNARACLCARCLVSDIYIRRLTFVYLSAWLHQVFGSHQKEDYSVIST